MFLSSSTGCSAMLSPTLRKRVGTTNLPRKVVGTTKLYRDKWLKLRTSSSSLWIPVTASFGHFFLALPFTQRLDPGLKLRTSIEVSGWNYETEKRGWNYEAGSGSFDDQHGVLGDLIPPFLGHFLTQIFQFSAR